MTNTDNAATAERIDYVAEIDRLRKETNAVILAHYYQIPEIQDVADIVGDSLELARRAKETDAETIVFCGVHFMAETAKILSPDRRVLLPDLDAGCSLADSAPAPLFKRFVESRPDHTVVSYINCSAAVKALSDVIVTSSNAEKIVRQLPEDKPIIFAPDRNLGAYVSRQTGREMTLWQGTCVVHEAYGEKAILKLREQYPDAKLVAHPECEERVLRRADFIGSTSKLLAFVRDDDAPTYIVATEPGVIHQMKKSAPTKTFVPAPANETCNCSDCPYMKLNTLKKVWRCMRDGEPEIIVDEETARRAMKPLERMLEMS
jgi:quinolinate synthase